jgi:hypothetical protein
VAIVDSLLAVRLPVSCTRAGGGEKMLEVSMNALIAQGRTTPQSPPSGPLHQPTGQPALLLRYEQRRRQRARQGLQLLVH